MPRETREPRDLIVRRYGVKNLGPQWQAAAEEYEGQLRLGNTLYNKLVELQNIAQAAREAAEDKDPPTQQARLALKAAQAEYDATSSEDTDAVAAAKATVQEARAAFSTAVKKARKIAVIAAALDKIDDGREAASTKARQDAVLAGLYWATATRVLDRFKTARKNMLSKRAAGAPAALHFVRYAGNGEIANQFGVLRKGEPPGMPVQVFADRRVTGELGPTLVKGSSSKRARANTRTVDLVALSVNEAAPRPVSRTRRGKVETVLWRPPGEERVASLSVNVHRELGGEDTRIKSASLVLTGNRDWTRLQPPERRWLARDSRLIITASATPGSTRIDAPGHEVVAINLGWRVVPGGLRVMTAVGQRRDLALLQTRGTNAAVMADQLTTIMPQARIDYMDAADKLRSERDKLLAAVAVPVVRDTPWATAPAAIMEFGSGLARAPKFGQRALARLIADWTLDAPNWEPDRLAALEAWRQQDNRLRSRQNAQKRHFLGWRKDWFRLIAKELAERATIVLVAATDYADLAQATKKLPAAVAHNRFLAASGELLSEIERAMKARGKEVVPMPGPATWAWCPVGNHPLDVPQQLRADLHYFCGRDRTQLDIDVSHCCFLLMRHAGTVAAAAD